jgi:hypothetical protein
MLFAVNGLVHGTAQLVSVLWTALCIVVAAGLAETVRQCTIIRPATLGHEDMLEESHKA